MHRLWEFLLGLDKGFLDQQGQHTLRFNPQWPWQQIVGAGTWNFLLGLGLLVMVIWIYRREGRSRGVRISLAVMRLALLAFALALLNNPVLTLSSSRTEPSVLAVLVDDTISMRVRDADPGAQNSLSRLDAVIAMLNANDQALLRELSRKHVVKFYRFDTTARPLGELAWRDANLVSGPATAPGAGVLEAIKDLRADGQSTQIVASVRAALDDLQGQRVAGVVVFTDGRDVPAEPLSEALEGLRNYGVRVYTVAMGSDKAPRNIEIQSVNMQDSAFKGDIVNVKAIVRAIGYEGGHLVTMLLKNKKTGEPLRDSDGHAVQLAAAMDSDRPQEVELQFKADQAGTLDVQVEAVAQPGELDDADNIRTAQLAVLDTQINVLFVEGYPRWEYRYIKNEMLREPSVNISCILTSADPNFAQEGDHPPGFKYFPFKYFPETMEQMMECDVVVFGDVDPRQFTDAQLQLVSDFVSRKRGGFEMIAGPHWSPQAFRNTAIEDLLPVSITRVQGGNWGADSVSTPSFRPALTKDGEASSIFRFFADKARNQKYIKEDIQELFWYCQGVSVKPGLGQVFAEHPTDLGPDGRRAPLLVVGQFGGGRTMFSGLDDSWRWRYYNHESVFDTYWIQQFRYLARGKKLGQRKLTFTSMRPAYEIGEQVKLNLNILDPQLLQQLPEQLSVDIEDGQGRVVGHESLVRQEGPSDMYVGSFVADRIGKFTVRLGSIASEVDAAQLPLEVMVPRLELAEPQVDRAFLSRLAAETLGSTVDPAQAAARLPALVPSAAKVIPMVTNQPLWDAPLAMGIFVLLITLEWVLRKVYGML
jgi:hypothetical protein